MTYYLGKAGTFVALPDPDVGLPQSVERIGGTHQLLSGGRVRDTVGRMRTWNLSWTGIDLATFAKLESFYYGAGGSGPWVLYDPEQRNLLATNVSSGTDTTLDTTGFVSAAGFTLASSANANFSMPGGPYPANGQRTLGVTVPAAAIINAFLVDSVALMPVASGFTYAFSAYIFKGADAFGTYATIEWLDSSLAHLSWSDGNHIAASTAARSVASAVAPANANWAKCRITTDAANSGSTVTDYTDGWQFEVKFDGTTGATAWFPGTGVPYVTAESLSRSTPLAGICDAQMTLQQVG